MDIALIFGGVVVSVIVQLLKVYLKTEKVWTLAIFVVLSLVASYLAWYLKRAGAWESFIQIASGAGLLYTFFIKNFEADTSNGGGEK